MLKGLRTIPVILDIIKDMEELCPDSWLVNFTNPSGMISEAVFRYTNWKRYVGLYNVPIGTELMLADMFGVDGSHIRIDFGGLNHMVFGKCVYIDGVDRTKEAVAFFARPSKEFSMRNIFAAPWVPELIEALGVILCPIIGITLKPMKCWLMS